MRIGAFSTISRRSVHRPRIVTQEKVFSEDYLRILRFSWGRRLDEPNQLELNFNRYVSRFSQNVCGIMERFAFDEQIARMAEKASLRSDQGVCSNRPRALDSSGISGGYGCSERRWYGHRLVIGLAHKSSFTKRQTHWKSNALCLPSTRGAKETRQER